MMSEKSEAVQFGPKMMALPPRQRAFVQHLFAPDMPRKGEGLHKLAARMAGYANGKSSSHNIGVMASRLMADKKVQEAVAEYGRGVIKTISPDAVAAVRALLQDKKHRDHAKVALAVIDKIDPTPKAPMVQIENTVVVQTGAEMIERIKFLAAKHGMDAAAILAGKMPPELLDMRAQLTDASENNNEEPRP